LEGFVLKGYGESINYRMGLPLLKDVVQSMEEAIIAKEGDSTLRVQQNKPVIIICFLEL